MSLVQIGKYQVGRLLGRGAMGQVYLAEDPYIQRRVAIKVMGGSEEASHERFLHEARTIGALSHPNIVLLLEFGFHEEQPFLVMEYLDGVSLQSWMRNQHSLPEQLKIMAGLCNAVSYAHERGVLHRDIKPSNVQVLPGGDCKLMDFGIARTSAAKLTQTGTVLGTPEYMAPEILTSAGYSNRSDLYSVGVVLYELLAGHNPFSAENIPACLHKVLTVEPAPLGGLRPDLPAELTGAIMALLHKEPQQRRPDLAALAAVIERMRLVASGALALPGHAEHEATYAFPTDKPPARTVPSRHRGWLARGVILVAAAVAAAGWLLSRRAVPPSLPVAPPAPTVKMPVSSGSPPARRTDEPTPPTSSRQAPVASREAASGSAQVHQTLSGRRGGDRPTSRFEPIPTPAAAPVPSPEPTGEPTSAARASPGAQPAPAEATARAASATAVPSVSPSGSPVAPTGELTPAVAASPAPAAVEQIAGPALEGLAPETARRGASVTLKLRGTGLRAGLRVVIRRGRVAADEIAVIRQLVRSDREVDVTVLVDEDAPLGSYTIAVEDAAGHLSNALVLEVDL